jgi:hypothetical protein
MSEMPLAEKLAFLRDRRRQDEAALLADVVREGIEALYQRTLIEAYLLGEIPRERVVEAIGPDELEEVEYQRDAIQRDVRWGVRGA